MQRLEDLVARFVQTAEASFVPRGEYAENRDAQDKVLERLVNSIDRLNERIGQLPSVREWEGVNKRLTDLETHAAAGQRFQLGSLIQQNKTLLSVLGTAAVTLLGAFLYGHLRIQ